MHVDVATSTLVLQSQERDRSKVPDEYKWDLTAIYPSDQAWRTAKEKLASELPKLRQFQGTLASNLHEGAAMIHAFNALGYAAAGRLEDWDSHGHDKLFFVKRLA